ncbi:hypothetical protein GH714_015392 [Hevea brasiliensis]|uniref:CUE domain-containing protein n=1 Tax=Hevea brasiliensis TaxID=3981 RepID=A0A6A6MF43_HEVBR|nr:hypothetical protein GH714_015392 [Hevea brasiliensis]
MSAIILERALEECGDDLDSAIRSLNELRLASADNNVESNVVRSDVLLESNVQQGITITSMEAPSTDDPSATPQLPMDGAEWVELFVREMTSASNMDDASSCFKSPGSSGEVCLCACWSGGSQNFQQENMMLKEQVQALIQENAILKRAVSIQHERQKEFGDRNQELQHLKQLVSQYQEQLRALEVELANS